MARSWLSLELPPRRKLESPRFSQDTAVANRRPGRCRQKACRKGREDWAFSRGSPGRNGEFLEVQDRPARQP